MTNILSQEEVDSLLGGIDEGKVPTDTDISTKDEKVEVYDFSMPAGPIHHRMPALGMINERFVNLLRTSLPIACRSVVDVTLTSTESVKFSEFCLSLPMPSSLNIFSMEPLRGFSMLVLEGSLVFSFVDGSFGGKGGSYVKLEGRGFTTIETKIVERIVKIILTDLQQAWSDIHEVKTAFIRSEMDPQFAAIATPEDIVIIFKFMVHLENGSGSITICVPYSSLEPIKKKLKYKFQGETIKADHAWKKYIEKKISDMVVELKCTMGKAKINGKELLQMKVDDVILMDQKVSEPITVEIGDIPKFKGHPGTFNNKKAVKISETLNKE